MLIKESLFRKILREEARRVMTEGDASKGWTPEEIKQQMQAFAGAGAATPLTGYDVAWEAANKILTTLNGSIGQLQGYRAIPAVWSQIRMKGALHPYAAAALQTINNLAGGQDPKGKLRGILSSLSTGKVFTGATAGAGADYDTDLNISKQVDAALEKDVKDMPGLIEKIKQVVSFDLGGAMMQQPPRTGTQAGKVHTVAKGETLSGIVQRYYGIPAAAASMPLYQQLASENGMSSPDKLKIGQALQLPLVLGDRNLNPNA